jgi:predicted unusual protein kinase regulating ubiquinone biosynthesis (AarF/ABC1/UbiB family)
MPDWQMEVSCLPLCFVSSLLCLFQQVLTSSFGPTYSTHFTSFDRIPFAAASIGQVHHAVLSASSSPTGIDEAVAVKIQFPNIVNSIESDLGYVKMLLTAGRLLPKGLFLDRTIQVDNAPSYTLPSSIQHRFFFIGNER